MKKKRPIQDITAKPTAFPGFKSPLFYIFLVLSIAVYFIANKNKQDDSQYLLELTITLLLTNNRRAHLGAAIGAFLSTNDSSTLKAFGFFSQATALIYAGYESYTTLKQQRAFRKVIYF